MKSSLLRILGLSLAVGCSSAYATLIGDTITITKYYPNTATPVLSLTTVVSAGTGDTLNDSGVLTINPGATGLVFQVLFPFGYLSAPFNGFIVTGIDDTLTGVTVSTNLGGWTSSRIAFDAHSTSLNLQNLSFNSDSFFDVFFQLQPANPTPDSGATLAMLGLAVLGLAALRRRVA